MEKLALYGFNNLTKTLSFNIYEVCITETENERRQYIEYIDERYNSHRLTEILIQLSANIGANILNISKQDYDPQGASVTMLISEEPVSLGSIDKSCNLGLLPLTNETVLAHLDKSHITVHSYPESHPGRGISTFRVDIDVSTCGKISPLKSLDYLIGSFDSDIMTIDYRVRGFTRLDSGKKVFIDEKVDSIQDYIRKKTLDRYDSIDVNIYQENIFHTKMMVKTLDLDNYLFERKASDLPKEKQMKLRKTLKREMKEIFYGRNLYE
ncbi:MAG TPA: adenosylmethionine decarboxylase [Bacillota bacterium]|nr:adenosylmethionine decarboxylase [Bacillota bacterium]HPF42484.1 adenosylmethionine decarboxylase [Bacillota bacterium]HPJ85843.1 adenosylmethionine decarboxylase [Bacillota bacterium]HPQ62145.1 adenosylmethionine decarboxylase [Bacillota bacterium]HRX91651.1 adenosylmethionine decarboxylase [Candidatus Izemoplasmatales bacterium]